jgi:septin family protein
MKWKEQQGHGLHYVQVLFFINKERPYLKKMDYMNMWKIITYVNIK